MIWTTLFGWVVDALSAVVSVFPSWSAPSADSAGGAGTLIGHGLQLVGPFVNVTLLLSAVGVVFASFLAAYTVRGATWLWGLIRG